MYAAIADSILAIEMLLNFSARREKVSIWHCLCMSIRARYLAMYIHTLHVCYITRLILKEEQLYTMRPSSGNKEL